MVMMIHVIQLTTQAKEYFRHSHNNIHTAKLSLRCVMETLDIPFFREFICFFWHWRHTKVNSIWHIRSSKFYLIGFHKIREISNFQEINVNYCPNVWKIEKVQQMIQNTQNVFTILSSIMINTHRNDTRFDAFVIWLCQRKRHLFYFLIIIDGVECRSEEQNYDW